MAMHSSHNEHGVPLAPLGCRFEAAQLLASQLNEAPKLPECHSGTNMDAPAGFMRRLRRRKEQQDRPPADLVNVPLPEPVTAAGASALAQSLLKHLLFMRQQIPMPFDQLAKELKFQQEEALDESRRRRTSSAVRKTTKLVEAVDAVLGGFKSLPLKKAGKQVLGIIISFGPTPINPKECYILRFECCNENDTDMVISEAPANKKKQDEVAGAARKMIRTLISSGVDQMSATAPAYKVYCLALVAPASTLRGGDVSGGGFHRMEGMSNSLQDEVFEGWMTRYGFVPKMRRCRPIIISVGSKEFLSTECPEQLSGIESSADVPMDAQKAMEMLWNHGHGVGDGSVWLQHEVSFKGLPQEQPVVG